MTISFDEYVTSGSFTRDAERFGFTPAARAEAKMPSPAFLERLPPPARASLRALAGLLEGGRMPEIYRFNTAMGGWGFDFAANGVEVLDANFEGDLSGDVFSLALDGGGNHFCLRADGRVVVWNHEESNIEDHTVFPSLDEALWCILHREAISHEKLAYAAVRATFEARAEAEGGWAFFREQIEESLT